MAGGFISMAVIIIFSLLFRQMGALQNLPPPGNPLGMESGAIPNSSLTASSQYDPLHGPHRARLNISGEGRLVGAWAAVKNVTQDQWIQVDLLTLYRISGVATQGRQDISDQQWVTSFKVACSVDGVAFENVKDIPNQPDADKVFTGNTDRDTVVYNTLPVAKVCRYVRLLPVTWNIWISLRMELYGEPSPDLNITLTFGNAPGEGFVLKDEGSTRGLLCASSWNLQSAEVACRTLGYVGLESFTQRSMDPSDPNSVPVLRDGYICTGFEATLSECSVTMASSACFVAGGVVCTNNTVRLSNRVWRRQQGRAEVYTEPTGWGSVCGDRLSRPDGQVFCRMLDYPDLESLWRSNYTANRFAISNVGLNCTGAEKSIDQCIYYEDDISCDRVAHFKCENAVRLVQGPCAYEGRVEIYREGSWGAVCDDNFTIADATIVCQMLELDVVDVISWDAETSPGDSKLTNPTCSGNETDIRFCMHELNATCNQYAAVLCSDPLGAISDCEYSSFDSINTPGQPLPTSQTQRTFPTSSSVSQATYQTPLQTTSQAGSYFVTTQSSIDRVLDEVLNETLSEDNIEHLSEELANVTKQATNIDEGELLLVTEKLETIVNFTSEQNLTEEIVEQVSVSVLGTVDNILNVPESNFKTRDTDRLVSRDILTSVSTLTGVIQRTSTTNFTHRGSNIVVAAVKIDRMRFPIRTTIGGAGNDVIDFSATETVPSDMPGATSVSLPQAILPSVPGGRETVPLSIFLVKPSKLFQTDKSSPSNRPTPSSEGKRTRQPKTIATSVLASPILSVTIEGADIKDLPENESILFAFPTHWSLVEIDNTSNITPRCVYWENALEEWSDKGCKTDNSAIADMVHCRCNHLTSFAVLMDIRGNVESRVIDLISRIGCITSIICLILTLTILLGFRKLRIEQPQQILINLCFALLALYVTFVIGIDRPTWGIGCTVVAVLLHYFCLASLVWMGIEAFSMYLLSVRVLNTYIPKFLLKCSLVGWGDCIEGQYRTPV